MNWTARRQAYRSILAGNACVYPASVFDPVSARIAEDLGFEVGMFAGSVASLAVLGAPDLIVLTLTEFAEQAYRICRAGKLPLMVDADHGYGNALNVMRTVEELETAGVAALSIEDTVLPQPYGPAKPALIPIEEGVGKMRAALRARQDKDLVIAGRTSAPSITGLDDAIARCKAYAAEGIDAIFVVGLRRMSEVEALCAEVKLPIILGGVAGELADPAALGRLGVRIGLQGHQPFMAAVQAVHDTLKALRDGTPPDRLGGIASAEMMKRVSRERDYRSFMAEFLASS